MRSASMGIRPDSRVSATDRRPVAHAFEGMEQPQGDHLTGPEVRLGMFGDGAHLLIDSGRIRRWTKSMVVMGSSVPGKV